MYYNNLTSLSLLLFILSSLSAKAQSADPQDMRDHCWQELNNRNYQRAISDADDSINSFGSQASTIQDDAVSTNAKMPAVGKTDQGGHDYIDNTFGLLNDVSACVYVRAVSHETRGDCTAARQDYSILVKYTYARIWNNKGFYWAPSVAADIWLKHGTSKCPILTH